MIFQYGWEPVLIQQILIGFEVILEKYLQEKESDGRDPEKESKIEILKTKKIMN